MLCLCLCVLVEPSALLARDLPRVGERERVGVAVLFPRVLESDNEVDEDGDKESDTDQDRAPELVERAGVAGGDHRQTLLVHDVSVDEDRGGTVGQLRQTQRRSTDGCLREAQRSKREASSEEYSHASVDPGELASDAVLGAEEETGCDSRQQHAHGQVRDEGTLVREPDLGLDLDGGGLLL